MTESIEHPKILLVEDESYVRDVACEILQDAGYQVVVARDGAEGIRLFKTHSPIQLLITDMIMPGMNGRDLADKLIAICPTLKTLYMSGYNQDYGDNPAPIAEVREPFIQKPFTLESLTAKVKEVLQAGRSMEAK